MTEYQTRKAKKPLRGSVFIASDKSISHRSIMLSAISGTGMEFKIDGFPNEYVNEIGIESLLESEDVIATIEAFRSMGVNIEKEREPTPSDWHVGGVGLRGLKKPDKVLNMGNSGTSARLMLGILAGQNFECVIDGDDSLRKRPMKRITEPLSQMGAKFEFLEKDGCLPIKIIGNPKLKPLKNYEMPVASAQIKSAILLAGLYANGETSIIEKETSRDHTENMLAHFGINIDKPSETIILKPDYLLSPIDGAIRIPADPSSAAFFITAALLVKNSEISFGLMGLNKTRTGFLDVVKKKLKCKIEIDEKNEIDGEPYASETTISYSKITGNYVIPAEYAPRMIDEYPILAVLAAGSEATIRMEGIRELRVKESDRIAVMEEGLKACEVDVSSGEDWMEVRGTGKIKGGAKIETHLDHRIAMSFIILGLIAEEPITIDDISPIQTSFPSFFKEMDRLFKYG